ncbi:MAG: domain S-box [Bacteroidota bacterium]|jgi:PAS domain S-box-containing protein|nr:domain S-box [Bacteroidota bacterium]
MTLSSKTKAELIAEVKKLQRQVKQKEKKKTTPHATRKEDLWTAIFKHSGNIVAVVDRQLNVLDVNMVSKGNKKEAVIGKKAFELAFPESHAIIKKSLNLVFKTGRPRTYTIKAFSTNGKPGIYSCKATPLYENKKRIAAIVEATNITKEVEAQEQLKQEEEKFRMLAQNAADIVYRYRTYPDFACEFISPSVKQITGYSQEEYYKDPAIGMRIIHPEDRHIAEANNKKIAESKGKTKSDPVVFRSIRKDKKVVWIESVNKPVWDKKGHMIAIEGITRDITDRKNAEEILRQSQENLSQVLNNIYELVYYIEFLPDGKKRVKYLSKQIKEILDVSQKEYINSSEKLISLCHPDDIDKIKKIARELRRTKKPQEFTYRFYHRSKKEYIWIEERITPQINEDGEHIGNFGLVRDVTAHIKSETQLKESEEKFRMLAENASDVVYRFALKPEPRYEYVSPSVYDITGYTPEEFYANPNLGFKLIHPDDRYILGDSEKIIFGKHRVNNVKEPNIKLRWVKKDGTVVWTETVNTPVKDAKGNVVAIEGISRDITEQKESEERFRILSNATFEGIVFSENGKIIDANDQFLKMYGYQYVSEIIGKDVVEDFVMKDERAMARRYMRLPKSEPYEVQTVRKDGSIITVETKAQNIPYFGKTIRATVIYNITERKQYETSLRESERAMSTLMNNLPGMAYRCNYDEAWTMRFVSKGCYDLTGYRPGELIDNRKASYNELILPEERKKIRSLVATAVEKKKPYVLSYKIRCSNDEIKWVWEKGEGVFSDEGKLLFLEGFIIDATERQKFEVELKRSRENYKSLVDYSPDGVFIHIDGKVVFANPSATKLVGIKNQEDALNYSLFDFLLPEYRERIVERIKKVIMGEPQEFIELKIKTLSGEIREVETKPILIRFNGKNAVLTVVHDISTQKKLVQEQTRAQIAEETNELLEQEITKRKVIQLQLQESQKYTRLLIQSSLDMICASDKEGYITEFNAAAERTFGYSAKEIIGKHMSMLYADSDQRSQITEEELYKKGAYSGEVINVRKNGEKFIAFLSASVLKNEAGEIVGAMGVSRDISELKQAEEQLRAQSAKLNAVFESSSHLIWTLDTNLCLTSFNQNYARFFKNHYGKEVYVGLQMAAGEMISTEDYNSFWVQKDKAVLRGERQHFETKLIDKHGYAIWREIYLNPIFDEDGKVREISGIGNDITEKKIAEEKIRQSLQEKEVLLKEVHHRVKNNLQVISSILNLQSSYVKDVGTLNILKESQNRIKSMAFIHESLYQTKDFSSINFSEYVVNLSHNLIQSYSNFDNEIKLNLDIQNVFLNLDLAIPCGLIINEIISNALKYAFVDKSADCEIVVKMILENEDLILVVGDNGRGLPKEIDYRNTQSLGLQLVVTLTDQLNGTIEMDSKNGTKYTIIFKQNQVKNRI